MYAILYPIWVLCIVCRPVFDVHILFCDLFYFLCIVCRLLFEVHVLLSVVFYLTCMRAICLLSFIWRACVLSCARFWTWMLSVVLSLTVFTYLLIGAPEYNRTNVSCILCVFTLPPLQLRLASLSLSLSLSLQNAERASKRERHIQKERERERVKKAELPEGQT